MKTNEEKRRYDKEYRLKNKEKIKQYRILNKKKIRESRVEYDIKNKEKIVKQQKEYKTKNKDRIEELKNEWKKNSPEKIKNYPCMSNEIRREVYKKYHANNKDKVRCYKLKKNYNITPEEYDNMFESQNGKCKICGIHQDVLSKKLVIDHDHNTSIIRGLLCDKCNRGLGHFNDNIDVLKIALNYLENSKK